jgi:hypothetical protein
LESVGIDKNGLVWGISFSQARNPILMWLNRWESTLELVCLDLKTGNLAKTQTNETYKSISKLTYDESKDRVLFVSRNEKEKFVRQLKLDKKENRIEVEKLKVLPAPPETNDEEYNLTVLPAGGLVVYGKKTYGEVKGYSYYETDLNYTPLVNKSDDYFLRDSPLGGKLTTIKNFFYIQSNELAEENTISSVGEFMNKNEITIFPNPTANYFNIKIEGNNSSNLNVEMYNLQGRMVHQCIIKNETKVFCQSLETGIYVVKVTSEDRQWFDKVFIRKN